MAHTLASVGGRQQEDTCALCREPIGATQALRTFPCLHALHHSCALDLFLHHRESRQWVRCPECRYQLHPDDTGRQMLRRAVASSMSAPSPMVQVPALTEGSELLGVPAVPEGTNRTPEEVEQLAIQAAEKLTQLREKAIRLYAQLSNNVNAVAARKIRARGFLTEFDASRSRSRGNTRLQLQCATCSRLGHREMLKLESVQILVYVD